MQNNTVLPKRKQWWACFIAISILSLVSTSYFNNYYPSYFTVPQRLWVYTFLYLAIWLLGNWGLNTIAADKNNKIGWHIIYSAMLLVMYLLAGIQHYIIEVPNYIREINAQCRTILYTPLPYLVLSTLRTGIKSK